MPVRATSLKLPADLKSRVDRLASGMGETPHALMVRAIEAQVEALERHAAFLEESVRADKAMEASCMGYAREDVEAYIRARLAGKRPRWPKPVAWRK
jgi:predicted transcriptional regulator